MKIPTSTSIWAAVALVATLCSNTAGAQESPSAPPPSPTPVPATSSAAAIPTAVPPPPPATTTVAPKPPAPSPTFNAGSGAPPVFPDEPRDNVTSPSFPDSEYVKLLDYSLLFYEAQRSGKLPPNQRVTWRNNSAMTDGSDVGVDLTGGYYDAGDYLKFIFPLTFTLAETCWGGLTYFEGYELANQTQYLDQMVRWGMDWLMKAHSNNDTLWVQVGTSDIDNNYWGPDTTIPGPRASFQVNRTSPGTDVMADASAAFSACSQLYRDKLNNATYATTLQTHAEVLYNLAETATPQQVYQTVVPAASCCYASSGFVDELAWGAAWLYSLTKNPIYAQKAGVYIDSENSQGIQTNPVTWDDKTGFVYILMASLTNGTSAYSKWQSLSEQFADFTKNAPKPCMFTKGGLYFCNGNSGDDTSVVSANAAFGLMLLSTQMESNSNGNATIQEKVSEYQAFALGQINYLLGDNPEKTPYVVGVHPNSPINPHSAPASGGDDPGTLDSYPAKEKYTIYGALVGGPDKNDRFEDRRSDWRQSEVALDYNAPFNGLIAYQVMTSKDSPPYVAIAAGRPDLPPILNGMEVWQIILIVIGSIFVAIVISAVVCYRKRDQIRAWAATRKYSNANGSANNSQYTIKHPQPLNRSQDHVVTALAVPPPPPMRQTQNRPVPPPPLPSRNDPILLQNARRS
ncbi:endoglucanase [Entomortierella parvispora]|uniref:Endoglucanase n=1 Tax=Entomortierella parvispora TaxID=205924 RepID=A0A9P3LRY4_9FUNG|nr:endoglucanase [Entomortierella parvispora]